MDKTYDLSMLKKTAMEIMREAVKNETRWWTEEETLNKGVRLGILRKKILYVIYAYVIDAKTLVLECSTRAMHIVV